MTPRVLYNPTLFYDEERGVCVCGNCKATVRLGQEHAWVPSSRMWEFMETHRIATKLVTHAGPKSGRVHKPKLPVEDQIGVDEVLIAEVEGRVQEDDLDPDHAADPNMADTMGADAGRWNEEETDEGSSLYFGQEDQDEEGVAASEVQEYDEPVSERETLPPCFSGVSFVTLVDELPEDLRSALRLLSGDEESLERHLNTPAEYERILDRWAGSTYMAAMTDGETNEDSPHRWTEELPGGVEVTYDVRTWMRPPAPPGYYWRRSSHPRVYENHPAPLRGWTLKRTADKPVRGREALEALVQEWAAHLGQQVDVNDGRSARERLAYLDTHEGDFWERLKQALKRKYKKPTLVVEERSDEPTALMYSGPVAGSFQDPASITGTLPLWTVTGHKKSRCEPVTIRLRNVGPRWWLRDAGDKPAETTTGRLDYLDDCRPHLGYVHHPRVDPTAPYKYRPGKGN